MKILGTGLLGLVGSRIVELLKDRYEFELSEIDITDRESIMSRIKSSNVPIVLHLAAKTDVDGCEKDKILGENGDAWKVNVNGTKNVADACQGSNKKLIYISTDFVFDGQNPPVGGYTEKDAPKPINWYAQTKYTGEKIVQNISTPWVIARIAYPYRANFARNDFARAILKRLQDEKPVTAVTDHIFTPTFVDDIAFAIDTLVKNNSEGIYHVVGSQSLTPYVAALAIAKSFNCSQLLITKTSRAEFFKSRASRPFRLALKNDKIQQLGVKMKRFEEGLLEVKRQIEKI